MSEIERYGTCSDGKGHWGIEDEGKVILSGLASHDACDAVMDILDERDALKAEVERLKEGNECLDQMHEKEMARSAFLCEEVNRTTAWGRGLESNLSWARAELLMVKAEVERMTKAGDAMAAHIERNDERCYIVLPDGDIRISEWNAAKEGKQP